MVKKIKDISQKLDVTKNIKKAPKSSLSERGILTNTPGRPDMNFIIQGIQDPYHPKNNPKGFINLVVADNKLCWPELKEKISQV